MVELRKRKAAEAPSPAPQTKRASSVKSAASKGKVTAAEKKDTPTNGAFLSSKIAVGDAIDLDGFGGEVETNEGEKTELKKLVEDSKGGVVLFTYPKASTPGCEIHSPGHCSLFDALSCISAFLSIVQQPCTLRLNPCRYYSSLSL